MAHISYRVSGRGPDGKLVARKFSVTEKGKARAHAFADGLVDVRTVYAVRYRVDGREHIRVFRQRKSANDYLVQVEADKLRGVLVDPRRAKITVTEYAKNWLAGRHDLAESTKDLYSWLLDRHILPTFGASSLGAISPSAVRTWRARIAKDHATTAAKAYRLLREILNTAVADENIVRNPCQVKGGGAENAPERPVATFAEVEALTDAMPDSQRVAVLLAAWCQLRLAEVLGLRRRDVDPLKGVVTVRTTRTKTMAGKMVDKDPKSDAGRRTVAVPPNVLPNLLDHLERHVGADPEALVLERGYSSLRTAWDNARRAVGVSYHFHDLRHAGLTWSAATGASTAELMRRAGHASPHAALRYQHATEDRDHVLAKALAELAQKAPVVEIGSARTKARGPYAD
ncbi:MAG: tyrosine-type recombinase/integrase [Actinomycetota bacterium]|nr:tyrosine-type recombinase/integrase [Actinomycetota bacterium]